MRFEVVREVGVSAEDLWEVVSAVESWPSWTDSISSVRLVSTGPLGAGSQIRVKQPGMPAMTWHVERWEPGSGFAWVARTPGLRVVADHLVTIAGERQSQLTLVVEYQGVLAGAVGRLWGKRTRRFMDMEAEGLKGRAESGASRWQI
jgi:uncharacterized membrane protein